MDWWGGLLFGVSPSRPAGCVKYHKDERRVSREGARRFCCNGRDVRAFRENHTT